MAWNWEDTDYVPTIQGPAATPPDTGTGGDVSIRPQITNPGTDTGAEDPSINPFSDLPAFTGSNSLSFNFGAIPRFRAPQFVAPTAESVLSEPGYKFGLDEGERSLQNSAAGRGLLRTGGTLKDILAWGQNYAGQHYTDAFNRALSSYDRTFQGAQAEYAPLLTEWQTLAQAQQRARELEFQRAWDEYTFGVNDTRRQEEGLLNFANTGG